MRGIAICAALLVLPALQSASASAQARSDDATEVSDVEVTAPKAVPIPEVGVGATLFSVEALQGFTCEARFARLQLAAGTASDEGLEASIRYTLASQALQATREAERVRLEAGAGRSTQKEVEEAELARQRAVNAYQAERRKTLKGLAYHPDYGIDWVALAERGGAEPPAEAMWPDRAPAAPGEGPPMEGASRDLANKDEMSLADIDGIVPIVGNLDSAIENVATRMITERGKPVLLVTGTMRNIRNYRVLAQGLLITVFDRADRVLDMAVADSNATRIPPGRSIRFAYRLTSPPTYAHRVRVSFAVPGVLTKRNYATWRCPDDDEGAPTERARVGSPLRPPLSNRPFRRMEPNEPR